MVSTSRSYPNDVYPQEERAQRAILNISQSIKNTRREDPLPKRNCLIDITALTKSLIIFAVK